MKNFVAFDFETANRYRDSICSVGLVFVENGAIVDTIYQLIDPEEEFDGMNIAIHGITPEDVEGAPTFDVFYQSIKDKIENKLMVAHYLAFDGYALRDNIKKYEIKPCENRLMCTFQLAKRLVPGQSSYSIKPLSQHYGIELNDHHHALADAIACAELMLKLVDEHEITDFDTLFNKTRIRPGILSTEGYRSSLLNNDLKDYDFSQFKASENVDVENPFYNRNVVFTGKLSFLTRIEAAEIVASKGGNPQKGITKETNYIILGDFEDVMIKGSKSNKLIKAEKMISDGIDLEIISEQDFIKMLNIKKESPA